MLEDGYGGTNWRSNLGMVCEAILLMVGKLDKLAVSRGTLLLLHKLAGLQSAFLNGP